jgi:hypothetical protein
LWKSSSSRKQKLEDVNMHKSPKQSTKIYTFCTNKSIDCVIKITFYLTKIKITISLTKNKSPKRKIYLYLYGCIQQYKTHNTRRIFSSFNQIYFSIKSNVTYVIVSNPSSQPKLTKQHNPLISTTHNCVYI